MFERVLFFCLLGLGYYVLDPAAVHYSRGEKNYCPMWTRIKSEPHRPERETQTAVTQAINAALLDVVVILLAVWAIAPVELPLTVAIAKTADVIKQCFEKITASTWF